MKNNEVELDEVMEIIKEKLALGGTVTFTPRGASMLPMLKGGRDIVVLKQHSGRLHFLDVALYRRENGAYVLHRVIGFDEDGGYIFCGDNQFKREHGIMDKDVIGVMTAFLRKGKKYTNDSFRYRVYCKILFRSRIPRFMYAGVKKYVLKSIGFDASHYKVDENEETSE